MDAREVYAARGISKYLLKYVQKGFLIRGEMEEAGFLRRYSSSRNWPKAKQIRTLGTVEERWTKTRVHYRDSQWRADDDRVLRDSTRPLMKRQGEDLALLLQDQRVRRSKRAQLSTAE